MSGLDTFNLALLNLFPIGILILDQERRVVCANRYCEELVNDLKDSDAAGRSPPECIRTSNTALLTFVERIFHAGKGQLHAPHFVTFPTDAGCKSLEIAVIRHATSIDPLERDTDALTIILIQDANKYKPFCQHRLRQAYDLTAAEANIAIAILHGKNVDEIAMERHVQTNTVRAHLKQVFSKTGVRRQSELVWRLSNNWFLHVQTP